MKIQEFIKDRNVKYDTVRQYIRNHPDLFQGHIGRRNKIVLDEVAVSILDKKYPRQDNVKLIQNTELFEQIIRLQEKNIKLQETITELSAAAAECKSVKQILAGTKQQLDNEKHHIWKLQDEYKAKQEELNKLSAEYNELKKQLADEQSKSWWDKLLGR